ncbi:MAG: UDP-4-amino-4,6-dideoxy-N-acetyl-beta-L-altrosamine N-acetyltransferase [Nitrospirae bacterium]|nr:UDP-4-amino-4,6-dideoxy-N-acetyl-beta-L-altrosamine N-acetyltransferase [Nitrospirota bacterium]
MRKGHQVVDFNKKMDFGDLVLLDFTSLGPEEVEMVRNWRNHETVRKWMYDSDIISRERHHVFIEGLRSDHRNAYWIVRNKAEDYLGVVYLNRVDFNNKNAFLGIYVNPDNHMRGSGHILMDCLKRLAFGEMRLHTLKLEVVGGNSQAVDFYRREGFRDEGRLKEFVFKDGNWYDVIIMGSINKDSGHA